ncbi:MAG: DUF1189 domain-containing protein, partial [Sedimentisphaerales bacterium]|nr:DUF1189 domain-containing protein [Sedimentisphaerales bacterium]
RRMEAEGSVKKKFSIIHIPVFSFFSKELYGDVGLRWKGVNFLYLFLILAICWIPAMIGIHAGFTDFVDNDAPAFVAQLPEITITNGEVSISEAQPYYIKVPDSCDVLAVLDTTGTNNSLEDANAPCLLTKSKITWKKSEFETQTIDLSKIEDFSLNSDDVMGWLRTASKFLVVTLYPAILLGSYVFRIVQALIYGAVGLLFALLFKVRLSYASLVRLAVVAMTPSMLGKTILGMADIHLPYAVLLSLALTLAYLLFAVNANAAIMPGEGESEGPEEMTSWG